MKLVSTALFSLVLTLSTQAALQSGDSLTPYEIRNSRTGDVYCQICAYGAKTGKVVAFGKMEDADFWQDLQKLQALTTTYPKLGVFAQVIDSSDLAAIKAKAASLGVKFPVVVAVEKDWDEAYKVNGVSRTIYYARQDNQIVWTTVGLAGTAEGDLTSRLKSQS